MKKLLVILYVVCYNQIIKQKVIKVNCFSYFLMRNEGENMQYCAVICELNPLHYGHEYIFRRAREISGCDKVIALMSGDFVQRAIPASADEYVRAFCALMCGADAVIELPAIYATASGERFAYGAVDILNTISNVTALVMGTESDDADIITHIAKLQAFESESFKNGLKNYLSEGLSYAKALTRVSAEESGFDTEKIYGVLTKPNNILAVAYAKALFQTNSKIRFMPVKRIGGDISDEMRGKYSSASAIRVCNDPAAIAQAMPDVSFAAYSDAIASHRVRYGELGTLIMHTLRTTDTEKLASVADCAEGFEYKLRSLAEKISDYDEMIRSAVTARFTRSRIMRICLHALLGITRDMQYDGYAFARLIGIRNDSAEMLSRMPENIIVNKAGEKHIPEKYLPHYLTDKRAAEIYSLITRTDGKPFYRKLLRV